ncbi:MAG: hypothetical protein JO021_09975, partial [Alphaproteobacteria bacterium]|nr:hypothetical protein [Alphaproteobacteria bacterium]
MKRWAAALAGMVLAASLGYYLGQHADRPADTPTIAIAPTPIAPTPAQPASSTPTPPVAARSTSTPAATPSEGLVYRRLLVDTSRAAPEACLMFSEPLASDPATHYEDYLKVEPAAKLAVKAIESRLCLGGLEFRNEYTVTVAAGLPAASGARSREAQTITVSLGEQPAMVGFATNGFILPRQGTDGVGIQTINVDKVRVKVSRVGDRILARTKLMKGKSDDDNWYQREVPSDATTLIWSGEMTVERAHNQRVTTMFPLADVLKPRKPGAYLIEADIRKPRSGNGEDEDYYYYDGRGGRQYATQWVIDTDLALTTLRGADGLHVFARALDSAQPIAGATVTLVAVNNDELGRAVTDASGHAAFDPGLLRGKAGAAPSVVMAFAPNDDFTALDLKRPAFDLSDRGVSGRATPGPVDAFVYADRGIYRPGETAYLSVLLRDRVAAAIDGTPVTLTINRPDGVMFRRMVLDGAKAGALSVPFAISDTAARGLWSAVASLGAASDPVGRVEFDVQDFVPQRLKVTLSSTATSLRLDDPVDVAVNGRFLYGAPAAGLSAEGEVKLTPEREPFSDFKGFRVGLFDDGFKEHTLPLAVAETQADGTTRTEVALRNVPPTTMALRAAIRVGLFEPGGRITSDRISLPVATKPVMLGVRPRFTDDRVQENSVASFEVRAFDAAGKPIARKAVQYTIIDELWDYSWYFSDGRWQYQTVV